MKAIRITFICRFSKTPHVDITDNYLNSSFFQMPQVAYNFLLMYYQLIILQQNTIFRISSIQEVKCNFRFESHDFLIHVVNIPLYKPNFSCCVITASHSDVFTTVCMNFIEIVFIRPCLLNSSVCTSTSSTSFIQRGFSGFNLYSILYIYILKLQGFVSALHKKINQHIMFLSFQAFLAYLQRHSLFRH